MRITAREILPLVAQLFNRAEEALLCLLLAAMTGLACLQIGLRFTAGGGLIWADPLIRYLVLWAGLLGAAVATRQGKHIAIDVLSYLLPPRFQTWLAAVINLFAAAVCLALTAAAITFIRNEALYGGRAVLDIASWQLLLVFPLTFGLSTLRFALRAVTALRDSIFARHRGAAPPVNSA